MPPWPTMAIFLVSALLLVMTPGPNTLYIVSRSIHQGAAAGIVSCAGVLAGTLVHVAVAALGLTALLLASATTLGIIQYGGAMVLITLGILTLAGSEGSVEPIDSAAHRSLGRVFVQGWLINVLNPKTALFFAAFLPQFIDAGRGSVALQIAVLGGLLALLGTVNDLVYALVGGRCGRWLRDRLRVRSGHRYLAGGVYIGIGLVTALTGPATK